MLFAVRLQRAVLAGGGTRAAAAGRHDVGYVLDGLQHAAEDVVEFAIAFFCGVWRERGDEMDFM